MASWHIRINGTPWCCRGDLERDPSPTVRSALLKVCCGQGSKVDALCLKAALAQIGYAWDEIEIVQSVCEMKESSDEMDARSGQRDDKP